ncbi:PAS domain S-box protein [Paenibacillus sp. PL2-23]|uniref:PAS domain S-box protein n=1 Tax=Paenibacillus sp. PL2-23 TaxID=2100729 RepID=UPI0030F62FFE
MLQHLFSNLTLVVVFLLLSAPYYGRYPYTHWTKLHKIGIGVVQGVFGLVLMLFTYQLENNIIIDYRYLSILISAYYGGFPSAIVCALILCVGRLFVNGVVDETALLAAALMLGMAGAAALIVKHVFHYWLQWTAMLAMSCGAIFFSLLFMLGLPSGIGIAMQFVPLLLAGGLIVAFFIQAQNYLRERAELNKVIARLAGQFQKQELKEVYEVALLEMLAFLRVRFGSIYSFNNGKNRMFCRAVRGKLLEVDRLDTHTITEAMDIVAATGEPLLYPNWKRHRPDSKIENELYKLGVRSTVHIPVIYNGKTIAVINLGSERPGHLTQKHIGLMAPIVSLLGFSVSLKAAEGKYKAVSESAHEAVILADSDAHIMSWNRGAEAMFGYSSDEAVGMPLGHIISERHRDSFRRGLEHYRFAGRTAVYGGAMELEGMRAEGSVFPAEISLNKWQTAGTLYYSCIIRDMTVRKESERLLSESVGKYRALIEHAVDLFIMNEFDPSSMPIMEVNERACQVLGYTREELVRMTPFDLSFKDVTFAAEYHQVLKRLTETGFAKFEMRLLTKAGEMIPVESVTQIIELNGKKVAISVLRDMTDRYRAELALKESEERNRRLIELLPNIVAVHANGEVLFVNEAGVGMLGGTKQEEFVGRRLLEFIHPDSRELVKARVQDTLIRDKRLPPIEEKLLRLDGQSFDAIVQSNRIVYQGVEAVLSVAHDITERKRAEGAMKDSEERYRRVFELSPNAICLYDKEGTISYANGKAVSLFQADSLSSLVGQSKFKLVHPQDKEESEERFGTILQEAMSEMTYESQYLTLQGTIFIAEVSLTCVYFDRKPFVLAYIRDISKSREEEERLHEANRVLRELSTLDGLTGIANRRHFDESFARAWEISAQSGSPLSILLFDIDYFKLYNDTYGHLGGDACLKGIAAGLSPLFRGQGELFARYGGEEFVVLLPGADASAARRAAVHIQERIAELRLPHEGSKVSHFVTVSLGASTAIAGPNLERADMIEAADKALYQAKIDGRDRMYMSGVFEGHIRVES